MIKNISDFIDKYDISYISVEFGQKIPRMERNVRDLMPLAARVSDPFF